MKGLRRAAEFLVFLVIVFSIRAWQQRDIPAGPAPSIRTAQLDGRSFSPPAGRPYLVQFWATWCPVCGTEQGAVEAIAKNHAVVTVAMRSGGDSEVGRYLREHALNYPVVNDPEGRLSAQWGVHAVPAAFFVDPGGKVRFVEFGYTSGIGMRLRLWLAGLMGE